MSESIHVSVVYIEGEPFLRHLQLPAGSTVQDALDHAGVLKRFPHIDLDAVHKIGIYGKPVKADTALEDGDRVELYRPITADPETVPRRDQEDEGSAEED